VSIAARQGITPPRKRGNILVRNLVNERALLGLLGFFGVLILWEVGGAAGVIDDAFFSRPSRILAAGALEIQKPRFWTDVQASMLEFAIGYILAIVLGIPLGLAAGWFRKLQWALDPWLNFFNSLPRVALLPILVIIFGLGLGSKVAVVFLGAFFSIIIPTLQGVRTVERRFLDVATSFRAPRGMLFTTVVGPSTVPFIVTGMRLGMARALIGVVTGELYAATIGLGVMIRRASEAREGDRMLFGVLIFTIAGIAGVELIRRFERRFQKWRPSSEVRR
jgi:ABC-type nitrate/sulfonate/bicarbonate transport system permease component